MKFLLNLGCDNAAFEPDPRPELAAILRKIAAYVESGEEHGFRTRLSGSEGSIFDPMLEIVQEEWFLKLKKDQGNFAFGFNPIKDQEAVSQLHILAGKAP